jgi:hypothetical protein
MCAACLTSYRGKAQGNQVLKGRHRFLFLRAYARGDKNLTAARIRPEAKRSTHGQGERRVRPAGGPNPLAVQHEGMSCGSQ